MKYFEFEVYGPVALFSDPATKPSEELTTYPVPTYGAIIGILKSIYWKPSFLWRVDSVRVMNEIKYHSEGASLPQKLFGYNPHERDIFYITTLVNVRYKVRAHIIPNPNQTNLIADGKNINKHITLAERYLERGGRRKVFLGKSDYIGFVKSAKFEEEKGFYDDELIKPIGTMFHSYIHADEVLDENDAGYLTACFQTGIKLKNGILQFDSPEKCPYKIKQKEERIMLFPNKKEVNALALDETT